MGILETLFSDVISWLEYRESSWMAKFDQIFRGDDDPRKRPQRQSAATSEMIPSHTHTS